MALRRVGVYYKLQMCIVIIMEKTPRYGTLLTSVKDPVRSASMADPDSYLFQPNVKITLLFSRKFQNIKNYDTHDD
jgi:hypothetical protein